MKRKNVFLMVLALCLIGFWSCEEDEPENKPYYGKWKSRVYPTADLSVTPPVHILQQMTFDFTNDAFTDEIAQSSSLEDPVLVKLVTIGGDIENSGGSSLEVSIQTISVITGATGDRSQDESIFNIIFDGSVGALLEKDFTATYEIYHEGDSMKLLLPTKLQTDLTEIKLGKIE